MSDGEAATPAGISAERWAELEPLLDGVLELSPERRQAYVDAVASRDATLAAELARLVAGLERPDPLLDRPAAERFPALFEDEDAAASAEVGARLQAALGDAYTIERDIGGGMSRVFVAWEARLGRRVVIKTLAPELAAGFSAERFARETRLAASLQQANIVPLLAAGSAGGLPYYTMPYVEGHSLRYRLAAEGPLPIGEAVGILRDVARALTYAHGQGVVHRDIKPANVLLSGGTAVVTDFGIAKAFGAARVPGADETLTGAGAGLGTPAYMAPEQAAGDPGTDQRADLYAFGCVAYEMLTGRPPFVGDTYEVVAAHFRKTPRPVAELRPDTPAALGVLIERCLEKDPARRPAHAAELLRALDGEESGPPRSRRRRRWYAAGAALAAMAALAPLVLRRARPAPPLRLTFAALPFDVAGGDTALNLRGEGIRDEILASVGRLPGVEITGWTAADRFRRRAAGNEAAVERQLGARLLLTAALRQSGGRMTLTAVLHDSVGDRTVLSGTFQRDTRDLGALTTDVAQAIADTLRSRFGGRLGALEGVVPGGGTTNGKALDLYLLGQALLARRGSGVQQSVETFEHAIALDPSFARAYAALADALQYYPFFVGTPAEEVRDRTVNAARRALELDSTLAEAHVALGTAYANAGRWDDSDAEFHHALALQPDNVSAHFTFGRLLVVQGREADALGELERARRLDRVSPIISIWLAYAFFIEGQRDSARIQMDRALELNSSLLAVSNLGALMALAQGQRDLARRLVAAPAPVGVMTSAPYVQARLGDTATANAMVRAMEANEPRPWFTDVERASIQLALGDTAGALAALERSARQSGPLWVVFMPLRSRAYDPVRRSPRFAALLRQAGLNVASLTAPNGGRR